MPRCRRCGEANREGARFCDSCGAILEDAFEIAEQRKIVTVVFCDVVESTRLGETTDPERLRSVLAAYFEHMRAIVQRHGGTVEKFIGDAVMAVFGVPVVHEDDALRAVRAAAEMSSAWHELGLQGRIGVMTGEVVTGTEERLATGDAVNIANRLEQSAEPGSAMIGEATFQLVQDAVEVEPVGPLELKGKSQPVRAYRLVRVREAHERLHSTPFVGRERELAAIGEALERVRAARRCELVTIVGDAGVGKSRLVLEALAPVDAAIVRGRCLPYGEGITYRPVVEVLTGLGVAPPDDAARDAIASLVGRSDAPTSPEEIASAFRRTLESVARERPLVVVFDDIQWGEERFRELIEHIALLSSVAPILLLCMARPELAEEHPTWPVTLRLEPLSDDDVDKLIGGRVPEQLGSRIARAAAGNPLFVEEMLAMADEAARDIAVPPTLQALLAARLDGLPRAERRLLECASIEGEVFHRGAMQVLSSDDRHVTARLAALVRKRLIRSEPAHIAGEDAFRFGHLLLRDAAYAGVSKAARAELHERYADWLDGREAGTSDVDEVVGYHLEQACRYRGALRLAAHEALSAEARRRLAAAGHRAGLRQDYAAAVSFFERAAALVPDAETDLALEIELSHCLFWMGRGDDAVRRTDALAERAERSGNRTAELAARIEGRRLRLPVDGGADEVVALVEEALPRFEAAGDDVALYVAHAALGGVEELRARLADSLRTWERAWACAGRAGFAPPDVLATHASCRFFGSTPISEVIEWLDANEPPAGRDEFMRAYRAGGLAMLGRLDDARAILGAMRSELAARGPDVLLANITSFESVWVERWAGDPAAAAEFGLTGWRLYEELGEEGFLAGQAGYLAQSLYELDRLDEAAHWAERARSTGTADDTWKEMLWRQVEAKLLARRGEHAAAEQLAHHAVTLADETDMLDAQGEVYADLAEVLMLGGKQTEAAAALERALDRYARKGNLVSSRRVQRKLAELGQ